MLAAYRAAATTVDRTAPGCRLTWPLVAGIGKVESGHASGGAVDADGTTRRPILGPQLTGTNGNAAIPDTDGGALDHDATWDRAVGPTQFIPSSWRIYGADGNGDGRADPDNVFDAGLATARYLCSSGGDLSGAAARHDAVFRYNHSEDYVATVLRWADAYASGALPVPDTTGPGDGDGGLADGPVVDGAPTLAALPSPSSRIPTAGGAPTAAAGSPVAVPPTLGGALAAGPEGPRAVAAPGPAAAPAAPPASSTFPATPTAPGAPGPKPASVATSPTTTSSTASTTTSSSLDLAHLHLGHHVDLELDDTPAGHVHHLEPGAEADATERPGTPEARSREAGAIDHRVLDHRVPDRSHPCRAVHGRAPRGGPGVRGPGRPALGIGRCRARDRPDDVHGARSPGPAPGRGDRGPRCPGSGHARGDQPHRGWRADGAERAGGRRCPRRPGARGTRRARRRVGLSPGALSPSLRRPGARGRGGWGLRGWVFAEGRSTAVG